MNDAKSWWAAIATIAVLVSYEALLALMRQRTPDRIARTSHIRLREDWFAAVSSQPGAELLAVQTLRNSLMSATMTASTAVLGLMGTMSLAAPSLYARFSEAISVAQLKPSLLLELVIMGLLFASLVCSAMAVRYYNHAGFIIGMPSQSPAREHWNEAGRVCVRRGGVLYSWGLRYLVLVAPILAAGLHPFAGPPAALLVVLVLYGFDRSETVVAHR